MSSVRRTITDIFRQALGYLRGYSRRSPLAGRHAPGSAFALRPELVDGAMSSLATSDANGPLLAAVAQIREEMTQARACTAAQTKLLDGLRRDLQAQRRKTRLLLDHRALDPEPGPTAHGSVPRTGLTLPVVEAAALPRPLHRHGLVTLDKVHTDRQAVALTFDDGPHPVHTPVLLDILAARRIPATFYVIGTMVQRYPDIVKRMVAEGHELGNHSWTHPNLSLLSDAEVLRQIDCTQDIIWRTVGYVPVTMRPPYGAFHAQQRQMLMAERNLPTVIWSVNSQDWRHPGEQAVVDKMVQGARPGAIILAHDIHRATISAIPAALDGLQARGFACVTVSELSGWDHWQAATTSPLGQVVDNDNTNDQVGSG